MGLRVGPLLSRLLVMKRPDLTLGIALPSSGINVGGMLLLFTG